MIEHVLSFITSLCTKKTSLLLQLFEDDEILTIKKLGAHDLKPLFFLYINVFFFIF